MPPFGKLDNDGRSLALLLVDRFQAAASPSRLSASADRGTGALILNRIMAKEEEEE
jgi:hypothetical protein